MVSNEASWFALKECCRADGLPHKGPKKTLAARLQEEQSKLMASIETFEPEVPQPVYDGTGVGLIFDARMARHRNLEDLSHPEQPARIIRIFEHLKEQGLVDRCVRIPCRKARQEELESKHTRPYVNSMLNLRTLSVEEAVQEQKRYKSVYFSPESTEAALLSAGAVLEAVERVCLGNVKRAVCVGRPPGHHAERDCAMGFSLFGNVAVAVAEARRRNLSQRTLIVDWDVHHGNGTQQMFEEDKTVLYFSVHRYDSGQFFPSQEYGSYTSHGTGAGIGYSVNVPWDVSEGLKNSRIGSPGDPEYLEAFSQVLLPIAAEFKPDLVVVSAGFDSALGDPIGECRVTPAGFHQLTKCLMEFASGRLVLALEGGYNLDSISASIASCVMALLEDAPSAVHEPRPVLPYYGETIKNVRAHFAQFWASLQEEGGSSRLLLKDCDARLQLAGNETETQTKLLGQAARKRITQKSAPPGILGGLGEAACPGRCIKRLKLFVDVKRKPGTDVQGIAWHNGQACWEIKLQRYQHIQNTTIRVVSPSFGDVDNAFQQSLVKLQAMQREFGLSVTKQGTWYWISKRKQVKNRHELFEDAKRKPGTNVQGISWNTCWTSWQIKLQRNGDKRNKQVQVVSTSSGDVDRAFRQSLVELQAMQREFGMSVTKQGTWYWISKKKLMKKRHELFEDAKRKPGTNVQGIFWSQFWASWQIEFQRNQDRRSARVRAVSPSFGDVDNAFQQSLAKLQAMQRESGTSVTREGSWYWISKKKLAKKTARSTHK